MLTDGIEGITGTTLFDLLVGAGCAPAAVAVPIVVDGAATALDAGTARGNVPTELPLDEVDPAVASLAVDS
jgi:hypothetical protein